MLGFHLVTASLRAVLSYDPVGGIERPEARLVTTVYWPSDRTEGIGDFGSPQRAHGPRLGAMLSARYGERRHGNVGTSDYRAGVTWRTGWRSPFFYDDPSVSNSGSL